MNYTKQTYENLIILHNRLCKSSINNYLEILEGISHILEEVKRYDLFPVDLSEKFYNALSKRDLLDFETNKLNLARELYIYLGKMLFSFSLTSNPNLDLYAHILELGRTEFSKSQAFGWGKEYSNIDYFQEESMFFKLNKRNILIDSEESFNNYCQKLREKPFETICDFKPEESIPDDIICNITNILEDKLKQYHKYIENNYPTIKQFFPAYNKNISVYLQVHLGSAYLVVINIYEALHYELNVCPNNISLLYRFSNIEEFDSKRTNSIMTGFKYPDYDNLHYLFGISEIHCELNRLFVRYASVDDLRDYLIYMLRGRLKKVSILSDKTIIIGDEKCMLLFDNVPTVDVLQKQLDKDRVCDYKYLAFRSNPDDSTRKMLETNNISIIDVNHLGMDLINNQNGDMIHWFIKSRLSNLQIDESYKFISIGDVLIKKLKNCPKGKEGWKQYEDIGGEIFCFLFADSFRNYTYEFQSTTADGIFRRDMVVNNTFKDSPSFWQLVKNDYKSNLIIIDFKNYQDPLNQDEFFNPSKYMTKLSGNFAIIFSRCGLDESAKKFQIKLLEENKLLLCLSDANLIDLITQKTNGQNPLCSLENIYYDLCKSK